MKKKPAIKDGYGRRVLIETIAAYKNDSNSIKVRLRSGDRFNMSWSNRDRQVKELARLDDFFDFGGK